MAYLEAEHGRPALDAMRAIKWALDPDGIMNPGKMSTSASRANARKARAQ
jgi:FAD/FMN-containing dehydrogenase